MIIDKISELQSRIHASPRFGFANHDAKALIDILGTTHALNVLGQMPDTEARLVVAAVEQLMKYAPLPNY